MTPTLLNGFLFPFFSWFILAMSLFYFLYPPDTKSLPFSEMHCARRWQTQAKQVNDFWAENSDENNQPRKWTERWVTWPICPWKEPFCLMIFVYQTLITRTSPAFINGIFTGNCYSAINIIKGVSDSTIVVPWIFITCQDRMLCHQFWGVSSYSRDTVDMEDLISHFMGWKIVVFKVNSKGPRSWFTICKDCPISQGYATC